MKARNGAADVDNRALAAALGCMAEAAIRDTNHPEKARTLSTPERVKAWIAEDKAWGKIESRLDHDESMVRRGAPSHPAELATRRAEQDAWEQRRYEELQAIRETPATSAADVLAKLEIGNVFGMWTGRDGDYEADCILAAMRDLRALAGISEPKMSRRSSKKHQADQAYG